MVYAAEVILKAHFFLGVIYLLLFTFEYFLNVIGPITRMFLSGKTQKDIENTSNGHGLIYLLTNIGWVTADAYIGSNSSTDFRFWQWLVLIIPLSLGFRKMIESIQYRFN